MTKVDKFRKIMSNIINIKVFLEKNFYVWLMSRHFFDENVNFLRASIILYKTVNVPSLARSFGKKPEVL